MSQTQPSFSGFARYFKTEQRVGDRLPYDCLLDENTIRLRDGAMMRSLHIEGFAFETADTDEVNHRQVVRAQALRAIGSSRFVLYHHIIRRRVKVTQEAEAGDPVSNHIHNLWQNRLGQRTLFVNDLFLTIVRRPAKGKVGAAESIVRFFGGGLGDEAKAAQQARDLRELAATSDALLAALAPYNPRLLGGYNSQNGRCSEPLELLSALYNGEMRPVLKPVIATSPAKHKEQKPSDLGHYLPYRRISFGLEAIEQSSLGEGRSFASILSLKDYPPHATPGMVDSLLRLPFEMTLTESFAFVDRQIGVEKVDLAVRRMRASDEDTQSLKMGLTQAKDDLISGNTSLGDHHLTVLVRAPSLKALEPAIAMGLSALADLGAVAVREDINLEPAFWAQFPGNEAYIARKGLISTQAYASFASLHSFPIGQAQGNHWGQSVTVFETTSATPYFFNFHKADLGNTIVIGPSGSGKTVILNFLIAQSRKFQPRTFVFDKDRGTEIFVRAIDGHYETIRPGEVTSFNPLKLPDNEQNRAFLRRFISKLVTRDNELLSPEEEAQIFEAVDANFAQDPNYRRLRYFRELLGGLSRPGPGDLSSRLAPWCEGARATGEWAWLFDNEDDGLDARASCLGFDMTALLNEPRLRTPVMMYLFHRIEEELDGTPTQIVIDEGWKALDDPIFADAIRNWMKTLRKRNAILVFATQSAADALESRISTALIEQSATQIFMPNPRAQAEDYCQGFGLTEHELDLVRSIPATARAFLVKHANHSVVARLDLSDQPEILTLLSGREATVRHLDALRLEHGDEPQNWYQALTGQPYPSGDIGYG